METAQVLARRSEGAYAKTVETDGFGVFAKNRRRKRGRMGLFVGVDIAAKRVEPRKLPGEPFAPRASIPPR